MMVGPVEPPRHRTVSALRSSQLSLSFSAQSRLPATVQMLRRSFCIAATHAQHSIYLAAMPVCQTKLPLTANEVHIASLP
jgi:hypothetical protein